MRGRGLTLLVMSVTRHIYNDDQMECSSSQHLTSMNRQLTQIDSVRII